MERGDGSTGQAVWFPPDAYAGFWRRLGVESLAQEAIGLSVDSLRPLAAITAR